MTRKVLAWRLSNTLEAEFCVKALNEALIRLGPPDIMNTDQGSQFTSWIWTDRLRKAGVKIAMDGKGRFLDSIFVKRLWRSLKYECVYLYAWRAEARHEPVLASGSNSTINSARIRPLADEPQMLFTGLKTIRRNPTGRHDL